MAKSPKELSSTLGNQQAIVLTDVKKKKEIVVHEIPGGTNLMENTDERFLNRAFGNWLRRVAAFEQFDFLLLKENEKTTEEKIEDFDADSLPKNSNQWELKGRPWLAERLTTHLLKNKVSGLSVRRDGIYAIKPVNAKTQISNENPDWCPTLKFVAKSQGQYSKHEI